MPKKLREAVGIDEGGEIIVDVVGDRLVLRALKPRVVDVDPRIVDELLRKEYSLETKRYGGMISSEKAGS